MQRIFGSVALVVTLLVAVMGPASLTAQQLSLVIDATSPASPYSTDVGRRRVFICRPNLPIQPIWGTDVYTDDSPICSAAMHAGVITQAQGGVVTIVIGEARDTFTGSKRNGIESSSWPSLRRSYSFEATRSGQLDWATSAAGLPSGFSTPLDVTCPAGSPTIVAGVTGIYGTDVYTTDSPICVAALHAGVITLTGGQVHFVTRGAQPTFTPSTRNGVTSRAYGAFDVSFSVSPVAQSSSTTAPVLVTTTTTTTGTLAVSPATSVGTMPAGSRATSVATNDCATFPNATAKGTSNTTATVSWSMMSGQCWLAAYASGEFTYRVAIVRWDKADGSPCPTSLDKFAVGWSFDLKNGSLDAHCTPLTSFYTSGAIKDNGLEADHDYVYRLWPILERDCSKFADCSDKAGPPMDLSLHTQLFAPVNTRPQLKEVLGLKATLGDMRCDQFYPDECTREVTYTWNPTTAAVSYVMSLDIRPSMDFRFSTGYTFSIAASPTPQFKWRGEVTGAIYSCLAIVTDPNNLPDPRKGECITTDFPWP